MQANIAILQREQQRTRLEMAQLGLAAGVPISAEGPELQAMANKVSTDPAPHRTAYPSMQPLAVLCCSLAYLGPCRTHEGFNKEDIGACCTITSRCSGDIRYADLTCVSHHRVLCEGMPNISGMEQVLQCSCLANPAGHHAWTGMVHIRRPSSCWAGMMGSSGPP